MTSRTPVSAEENPYVVYSALRFAANRLRAEYIARNDFEAHARVTDELYTVGLYDLDAQRELARKFNAEREALTDDPA